MVTCQRNCQCTVNTGGLGPTRTVTLPLFLLTFQSAVPVVKLRKYTWGQTPHRSPLKITNREKIHNLHYACILLARLFFECTCFLYRVKDSSQRRNFKWIFMYKCKVGNRKSNQERRNASCYHFEVVKQRKTFELSFFLCADREIRPSFLNICISKLPFIHNYSLSNF